MQPTYTSLSSSGSTRWFQSDWWRNPISPLGISVISSGGAAWTLDVTLDDPSGQFPNPLLNPGAPSGAGPGTIGGKNVTVYNSSQIFGSSQSGGSSGGVTAQAFAITQPIAAWRLTLNNSSLGPVAATMLQGGPR